MSIEGLLNQTITIYSKSAFSADGRASFTTETEVDARFQATTKQRVLPNNALITILAIAYVPSDTVVNIDDKVSYGGVNYKVFGKYAAIDGDGCTNHIKLELIKWQA